MSEETRTCKACKQVKNLGDFATYTRSGKKIPMHVCKTCHRERERERQRRYLSENRKAHNERSRNYKRQRYNADPEYRDKMRMESKKYYEENKDEVLAKRMERYHQPFQLRTLLPRSEFKTYEEELEETLAELRGFR